MAQSKEEIAAKKAARYAAHRAEQAVWAAAYYIRNKDKIAEYSKDYRRGHKSELRQRNVTYEAALKMSAFNAYGGAKCACCGETLIEGLTIDHVGGDGAKERKEQNNKGGRVFYRWLKKNGYPPGYQVLCATCNLAKGTDDHCPHEDLHIAWG